MNGADDKAVKAKKLIDGAGDTGWNALHWAVYLGYVEVAKLLLSLGGNINTVSHDGWTPLQLGIHKNHSESNESISLHSNRVIVVKLILRGPYDVDINKISNRTTAIHIAAKNGRPDIVALVLKANPDLK